jgi:hypothetical protein
MARKRKKTVNQQEYDKQIKRLKSFIKRAEKRGYRFENDIIPDKPQRITKKTINDLKKITPNKLYSKATHESGLSGTDARNQERQIAADRAKRTKNIKKFYKTEDGEQWKKDFGKTETSLSAEQERRRRELDEQQKMQAHMYQEGSMVYQQIKDLINKYPTNGSEYLKKLLKSEISKYGEDAVIMSIAQSPEEFIKKAQEIVYYQSGDASTNHNSLKSFADMITGTIPTEEDMMEMGEVMDCMGYNDIPS